MVNKTYKALCKELKNLVKVRKRAEKADNEKLQQACDKKIAALIAQIKANKDAFSNFSEEAINDMFDDEKTYNRVMDEKDKYEEMSSIIENISEKESIEMSDVNKLMGKKSLKSKIIKFALGSAVLASVIGGISSCNKNNKENEPKETVTNTQEYTPTEEYSSEEIEVEYTEKEGAVVKFSDTQEETIKQPSNTNYNTTSNNTNTSENKTEEKENKDKDNKKDNKDKNNKDKNNKKEDKNNDKTVDTTEDKEKDDTTTEENKTETPTTEETTNTDTSSTEEEEKHTEIIIEEPAPELPDDMPIEEDEEDNTYYDINGNETTKEEADKSYEESTNENVQNSTNENVQNSNNNTSTEEVQNQEKVEQSTPDIQNGMVVEGEDEVYYDINGNETTKEEADKSYEQSESVSLSSTQALIAQYNEVKAELEQLRSSMEEESTLTLSNI